MKFKALINDKVWLRFSIGETSFQQKPAFCHRTNLKTETEFSHLMEPYIPYFRVLIFSYFQFPFNFQKWINICPRREIL